MELLLFFGGHDPITSNFELFIISDPFYSRN